MIADGGVSPVGIVGLFPAQAEGDDIRVAFGQSVSADSAVIHGLRQQFGKGDRDNVALSDFVAPADSGRADWLGAFVVTAGGAPERMARAFEAEHDDYSSIMVKALADRLAEAFAEYLHAHVRTDMWGYAASGAFDNDALVAERYSGIRPAPGYPACPDHTEKLTLFKLLDVEATIGVALTESFAMTPGASVSGWYFSHPESRYFGMGRVGRDQVEDYARRKGWTLKEAESWLQPNLGYEPGTAS
jgi:5-methyltetrahydrofolate--homocysteine methyltransferase